MSAYDQHGAENARHCSVCGCAVAEEWEYLECTGCSAVVCSACIRRVDGRRICPVCSVELVPGTGHPCTITGVIEEGPRPLITWPIFAERARLPSL
ncbi:MAG: hypothetical protein QF415_02295 [Candidatus Undinarchaeales archaeon]|nr:hypothetical protein [Candidatus Undinarchaeales archaeon]MDP7492234.1 hypothetical protein [Candidatus Undinarchaeales archaeon]